jgi:hypothetical protein
MTISSVTPYAGGVPLRTGQTPAVFSTNTGTMLTYITTYIPELNVTVGQINDEVVAISGLSAAAESSATAAEDSKNQMVSITQSYTAGHQGSWPTAITTRNNGSALQQADQFFYTGATGGGYTQNTTYSWNDTLNQWEVSPVPGIYVTKRQIITTTATWTKPSKFREGSLILTGTGAGASGCSSGLPGLSGGNAGEWVYRMPVDVSAVSSALATIGAGGTAVNGGGVNAAGNAGGATTFGALVTLAGAAATPSSGGRAATVGGPLGGVSNSSSTPSLVAQSNMSAIGGNAGVASAPGASSQADGAGGIVLDDIGTKGASSGIAMGGIGYGAGGASSTFNSGTSGAGAPGAILLEWEERA